MLQPPLKPLRRVMMTVDAVGGVWRYALDLARMFSLRGIEVVLVGLGPKPEDAHTGAGVGALRGVSVRWTHLPLDWMVQEASQIDGIPDALARIAEDEGPDLIHLNLPTQAVDLRPPCPMVVAAHSCLATWWSAVREEGLPPHLHWHRERTGAGLRAADIAITPSETHADALRATYGDLPRLRVVRNGSAVGLVPRAPAEFVFSAGRWWDPAKGLDTLDRAAAKSRWPILIAGELRAPDGKTQHPTHVRPLGRLPRERLDNMLASAPIFVSAARYEPFGLCVLEAANAGAALVLSDIPTFRELWDRAALFVDPTDADGLARALNGLADNPAERIRLAHAAHRRAARYTLEAQAAATLDAYADAAMHHRAALAAAG